MRRRAVACATFRRPRMCTRRPLCHLPFIPGRGGKEAVAPLRWRGGPDDFESTADRVTTVTVAKFVLPSQALLLDVGAFWIVANILSGNAGAVGFAEGVTAGDERHGFLIIHRHAGEGLADVAGGGKRIRLSIRPFRVHINKTHLHGSERFRQITIAAVALVREPLALRAPENVLFGLPHVL